MPKDIPIPETRSAVYAGKLPSPPAELNTLVPEDFDAIDFEFMDLKPKLKNDEDFTKTDHTFDDIKTEEAKESEYEQKHSEQADAIKIKSRETAEIDQESKLSEIRKDLILEEIPKITKQPILTSVAADKAVEVVETSVINASEEGKDSETVPIISKTPETFIVENSVVKVSNAKKLIEASLATDVAKEPECLSAKVDPVIIDGVVSKPKSPAPSNAVLLTEEVVVADSQQKDEVDATSTPVLDKEEKEKLSQQNDEIEALTAISNVSNDKPKAIIVEEVSAPPPLPTDNSHLIAIRESLKPSLLPVKPVNGAPSHNSEALKPMENVTDKAMKVNSQELECLRKQLEEHERKLEKEINSKKSLESQIITIISKSNGQEEALRFKNESLDQLQSEFLKVSNDLTSAKREKEILAEALAKAEEELSASSESNAKVYLQKSDEVTTLKDRLAEFAAIIGQKNKEIASLQRQLEETKRSNMNAALENVQKYENIEDDLIKMVEEEIFRMQDTISEQREYISKLQIEVDSEYAFWNRRLAKDGES